MRAVFLLVLALLWGVPVKAETLSSFATSPANSTDYVVTLRPCALPGLNGCPPTGFENLKAPISSILGAGGVNISALPTLANAWPGWNFADGWKLAQVPASLAGLEGLLLAQPTDTGAGGAAWSGTILVYRSGGTSPLAAWAAGLPTTDTGNGGMWLAGNFIAFSSSGTYTGSDFLTLLMLQLPTVNGGVGTVWRAGSFVGMGHS